MKNIWKNISLICCTFLIVLSVFFQINTSKVEALPECGLGCTKTSIFGKLSSYTPNTNKAAFKNSPTSIDFFTLYGSSKNIPVYYGEIPKAMHKDNKEYKYMETEVIDGAKRTWASKNDLNLNSSSSIDNDLHLYALNNADSGFSNIFNTIFGAILNFFCSIPLFIGNILLDIVFLLRALNMASIFDALNLDVLSKKLNEVFLFSSTGGISPFLVLCLIGFVIGLTGAIIRGIKGDRALAEAKEDLFGFVISIIIVGISLTGNAYTIGEGVTNIVTSLEEKMALATNDTYALFAQQTTNTDKSSDLIATYKALIKKNELDIKIEGQFGYSVSELELSSFGTDWKSRVQKITNKSDSNLFCVTNNKSGCDGTVNNNSVNNLGYYLWAANSNVDTRKPFNGSSIKLSNNERVAYAIDFLNLTYQETTDSNTKLKTKQIVNSLVDSSNTYGISANLLLLGVRNIMLVWALARVIINIVLGKALVIAVWILLPVVGPLWLFKKTKPLAKQIMGLFILGFFKLTFYGILFDTLILVCATVGGMGTVGILVTIPIMWALATKGLPYLQDYIEQNIINQVIPSSYSGKMMYAANRLGNSFRNKTESKVNKGWNKARNFAVDHTYKKGFGTSGRSMQDRLKDNKITRGAAGLANAVKPSTIVDNMYQNTKTKNDAIQEARNEANANLLDKGKTGENMNTNKEIKKANNGFTTGVRGVINSGLINAFASDETKKAFNEQRAIDREKKMSAKLNSKEASAPEKKLNKTMEEFNALEADKEFATVSEEKLPALIVRKQEEFTKSRVAELQANNPKYQELKRRKEEIDKTVNLPEEEKKMMMEAINRKQKAIASSLESKLTSDESFLKEKKEIETKIKERYDKMNLDTASIRKETEKYISEHINEFSTIDKTAELKKIEEATKSKINEFSNSLKSQGITGQEYESKMVKFSEDANQEQTKRAEIIMNTKTQKEFVDQQMKKMTDKIQVMCDKKLTESQSELYKKINNDLLVNGQLNKELEATLKVKYGEQYLNNVKKTVETMRDSQDKVREIHKEEIFQKEFDKRMDNFVYKQNEKTVEKMKDDADNIAKDLNTRFKIKGNDNK